MQGKRTSSCHNLCYNLCYYLCHKFSYTLCNNECNNVSHNITYALRYGITYESRPSSFMVKNYPTGAKARIKPIRTNRDNKSLIKTAVVQPFQELYRTLFKPRPHQMRPLILICFLGMLAYYATLQGRKWSISVINNDLFCYLFQLLINLVPAMSTVKFGS
jgi:hypothetical protein